MTKSIMTEKEREKFRKKAEKKNTKKLNKLLTQAPLFAEQIKAEVELTDAEQEYWHWRRNKAIGGLSSFGSDPYQSLLLMEEKAKARLARELLGEEHFAKLARYCYRTYPSSQYWMSFWRKVCTTNEQVCYSMHLEFDPTRITKWNSDGRYIVRDGIFPPAGWIPPMSSAEWESRFNVQAVVRLPPPDDGGLADKVKEFFASQQRLKGG